MDKGKNIFNKLRKIFLEIDPEGIYYPEDKNTDEYDSEIQKIMEKINMVSSFEELNDLILDIFSKNFDKKSVLRKKENYEKVSLKIWEILKR